VGRGSSLRTAYADAFIAKHPCRCSSYAECTGISEHVAVWYPPPLHWIAMRWQLLSLLSLLAWWAPVAAKKDGEVWELTPKNFDTKTSQGDWLIRYVGPTATRGAIPSSLSRPLSVPRAGDRACCMEFFTISCLQFYCAVVFALPAHEAAFQGSRQTVEGQSAFRERRCH